MQHSFVRGRYRVRLAETEAERDAAQRLRHRCFIGQEGRDADRFDPHFDHILVETAQGALVATCRLHLLTCKGADAESYVAQFYDLSPLAGSGPMLELGRFCVEPSVRDADVLRVVWGALAEIVDRTGASLLIGCTSFKGTDPKAFCHGFAHLNAHHLGPEALRPRRKAPLCFDFPQAETDPKAASRELPSLLRTYLMMGGWVSDHGVIDPDMGTLHVFTAVPVAAISRARERSIRAACA